MLYMYGSCLGECLAPETWVTLTPLEACTGYEKGYKCEMGSHKSSGWKELSSKINRYLFWSGKHSP